MKQLFLILLFLVGSTQTFGASRFLLPQTSPERGPWFEGWYIRITDPKQDLSFAVISASATHQPQRLEQGVVLPGYLALLFKGPEQMETETQEYFPAQTWSETRGDRFVWRAEDYGFLTEDQAYYIFPNGDELRLRMGNRKAWSPTWSDWGPNGWATFISWLPLHWYVDSLGTQTDYELKIAKTGEVFKGRGFAHIEKNWGRSFPKAWIWAQATSDDNSAHLALAGGPLNIGGVNVTSFIVGYKTAKYDVEIRPDQLLQTSFRTHMDACNGELLIHASNLKYTLLVSAKAEPKSFGKVSIPTPKGYQSNAGMESFSTIFEVQLWANKTLLERRWFRGGALEFGADFMCKTL